MAEFPSYAKMLVDGNSLGIEPSVERTEMERGVPKQRLKNTNVMMTLKVNIALFSKADANAFYNWYFTEINRIGWFTFKHPLTDQVTTGRFPGGALGETQSVGSGYALSVIPVSIEYLK